jgi:excisionase family DNA binding protein
MPMTGRWLTVAELAQEFRFSPATVTRWIQAGDLEAFRVGRRSWRVSRDALEAYLAQRRATPRRSGGGA